MIDLPIHENVKRRFMVKFNRYEPLDKDHTAISTAKICFRKYFYQIVLAFVPKEEAVYFAWGSAYHRFRETLTVEYGYGPNTPRPFDEDKAKAAFVKAAQAGLTIWNERGQDQEVGTRFAFMTAERLLETFKVAYNNWMLERKRAIITVLATEQPFVVTLPNGERTSGRMDELVLWMDELWNRDFKASSKNPDFFVRSVTPNDQATRYTFAGTQLAGRPLAGTIFEQMWNDNHAKTKRRGPEIIAHTARRTDFEVEQWIEEEMQFRSILDLCREKDIYPQEESACSFCAYHSVCSKGTEAGAMYELESRFVVRPWDNTKIGLIDEEIK